MKLSNACYKYAALNYHSELCKLLKGAGADISTVTYNAQWVACFYRKPRKEQWILT